MTSHQKAVVLLRRHGPMNHLEFGPVMWPISYKYGNKFCLDKKSSKFLSGMVKAGLAKKMTRTNTTPRYYV